MTIETTATPRPWDQVAIEREARRLRAEYLARIAGRAGRALARLARRVLSGGRSAPGLTAGA